jgi:tetratricopeptide (TPR) repeat protein
MRANYLHVVVAAALTALFATTASAQVGRVSGLVKDDSGSAIKGATVTAENPNIGPTTYTATTDDRGRFTIIGLRAGQWRKNGPLPTAPLGNVTARDLQAQLTAAEALYTQQKWDEAIAAYKAIVAKTPALSVVNLQIASAYRNKKDYDNAVAAYEAVLAADPASDKARVGIAAINVERGDSAKAEATLLQAVEKEAAGRDVYFNLAEIKSSKGEADEATRLYRKAADADPFWGKPRYKMGLLAIKGGDSAAAARLMKEVVSVDPTSAEAALARTALEQLNK